MKKKYRRLCAEDRKVIYNMNKARFGQKEIAQAIGFSQSAVSKELSRNKGKRGYRNQDFTQHSVIRSTKERPRLVPRVEGAPSGEGPTRSRHGDRLRMLGDGLGGRKRDNPARKQILPGKTNPTHARHSARKSLSVFSGIG